MNKQSSIAALLLCSYFITCIANIESASSAISAEMQNLAELDDLEGIQARMVGGNIADPGQFSFMAQILREREDGFNFSCSAVIIDRLHLLTSRHCVELNRRTERDLVEPKMLRVVVGDHSRSKVDGEMSFKVANISCSNQDEFGIAMLTLNQSMEFKQTLDGFGSVRAIELMSTGGRYRHRESVTVIGWGESSYLEESQQLPDKMKYLEMNILKRRKCKKYIRWINFEMVCASHPSSHPYLGDSGGALTRSVNGRQELIGITYGGITTIPWIKISAFDRIDVHLDWIKSNLRE